MVEKILRYGNTYNQPSHPIRKIYPLLMFFKTIGLLPVSAHVDFYQKNDRNFQPSHFGTVYNIVLLIIYLFLHIVMMICQAASTDPAISALIGNIMFYRIILSAISAIVILLNYCFKQKSMARVGNGLMEVHNTFSATKFLPRRKPVLRRFITIGIANFLLLATMSVSLYVEHRKTISWAFIHIRIYLITETFVSFLISFSVIQYILVVRYIVAKFVETNRCIRGISKSLKIIILNRKRRTASNSSAISCIIFVKDMYRQLLGISNAANDCFSAAILVITMYVFYNLTTDIFYLIAVFVLNNKNDYMSLVYLIVHSCNSAIPVCLLAFAITQLRKETEETASIVHYLLNCTKDPELISELSLFSLQLLHEKPHFTACGFFNLDCSLLQGIIGAVTTYMVILIQFQVSTGQQ